MTAKELLDYKKMIEASEAAKTSTTTPAPRNKYASLILRISTQTAQGKKYLAIKDRKYTLTETPCADLDMFAMKFGEFGEFGKIYPLYPRLAHCNGRAYVLDIWTGKKQVIFYG